MATPATSVGKPQQSSVNHARDQLLEKIRSDKQLPTLGGALSKVIEISSSNDDSIADLARYILADVALTQQILRLANTITYRAAGGGSVTTVSRAIFLLGFDTIKSNAIAAMLVDGFRSQSHAEHVRKELIIALCASVAAREIIKHGQHGQIEESAVAALFKNLGRILVAFFEPEIYQQITQQSRDRQLHPNQICIEFFGCSFERLGEIVMHDWRIPETIIHASQNNSFGLHGIQHDPDHLRRVATLSEEVAEYIVHHHQHSVSQTSNSGENGTESEKQINLLAKRSKEILGLNRSQLMTVVHHVEKEATQLASSFHVNFNSIATSGAKSRIPIAKESDFYTEFALPAFDMQMFQAGPCHPSGKPKNARDPLLAGIQDASEMLISPQLRLNDVLLLTLETLHKAMGFRFTTACLSDVQRTRYSARLSVGHNFIQHQKAFQFSAYGDDHIFKLALQNNTDLFIDDVANERIRSLLPEWFQAEFAEVKSFIVLPLVVDKLPIGLIYADRKLIAAEGIAADETALIKTLKAQLLAAMSRRTN